MEIRNACAIVFVFGVIYFVTPFFFVSSSAEKNGCQILRKNRCSSELCGKVTCPPVEECASGHFEKSSSCSCCGSCIVYLDEDEPCDSTDNPKEGFVKYKCKHGLSCQEKRCKFDENATSCVTHLKHRNVLLSYTEGDFQQPFYPFSRDLWFPKCDNRGLFETKQCKKKKCFCVDKEGNRIFGQEERDLSQNMTCGCSKHMWLLQNENPDIWMTKPQYHCSQDGNYDSLQCLGNICFCANPITGDVDGRVANMSFMEILPCYDSEKHSKLYKTQCEKQLMRARSLVYRFKQKGMHIVGLEDVKCDEDGSFAPRQCQTDRCVCTDRNGVSIKSYGVETKEIEFVRDMKCSCARDEHDREAFHARYPRMMCDAIGNYEPHQCFDGKCYCVDEDGDVIVDNIPLEMGGIKKLSTYCSYRRFQLNNIGGLLEPLTTEIPNITTTTDDDYDIYGE